jgi:hypothetical protein
MDCSVSFTTGCWYPEDLCSTRSLITSRREEGGVPEPWLLGQHLNSYKITAKTSQSWLPLSVGHPRFLESNYIPDAG